MSLNAARIERIKLKDLPALAAAVVNGAAPDTFIPITKHRAIAHIHNPYAEPDDVALLLAQEGDRNVGYFGLMPVMLQHEGKLHKVHWLTTWAVAPDYLGKGLGSQLMEAAVAVDGDLAIVGSKPARRIANKYGFREVKTLHYVRIDFGVAGRSNPAGSFLRAIRKILAVFRVRINIDRVDRPIARFFDLLFAPLLRPWLIGGLARKAGSTEKTIRMQRVQQVKPGTWQMGQRTGFYRGIEVVNWMLAHPWVLPSGQSESERLNYGFTDARLGFEVSGWQLSAESGESLGFVCFQSSRINGRIVLKVLDYQLAPTSPSLLAVALQQARGVRADIMEGPAELAEPLRGSRLERLLVRRRQRTLQVHLRSGDSPMARAWPHIEQSYCDGDMAFT
ncbi:MAG: GNAT family N-acetyltransferase [Anaerolineales bacterium]